MPQSADLFFVTYHGYSTIDSSKIVLTQFNFKSIPCLEVTCSTCHTSQQAKLDKNYMYVLKITTTLHQNIPTQSLFVYDHNSKSYLSLTVYPCQMLTLGSAHSLSLFLTNNPSRVALQPQCHVLKLSLFNMTKFSSLGALEFQEAQLPSKYLQFFHQWVPPLSCESQEAVKILLYLSDLSGRSKYRTVVWEGCQVNAPMATIYQRKKRTCNFDGIANSSGFLTHEHSCPSVFMCSRLVLGPPRMPISEDTQVSHIKWHSICAEPKHLLLHTFNHL